MRNRLLGGLLSVLLLSACAPKADNVVLKEGTPAFALANDLAAVFPALGPDRTTVVVKAKGFVITAADVIQAIRDNMGTRTDQLKGFDAGKLKNIIEQSATQLAERRLLRAAAVVAKTAVPVQDLDKALQSEYARAGNEQAFLEALKGAEISIDHVKKNIQETLLISSYLKGIAEAGSKVTEDDLRRAYGQETTGDKTASVRHILILTQGKTDPEKAEARKRIEEILVRAKAGEDFAELARQFSEDPGSKDKGGLYENFGRGQMVKPFEDAAFSIPVGDISGIVETIYGYHIVKVVDRKKETRPFEEVRGELESRLKQDRQGTVVQDHIRRLKDKAKFTLIGL